MSTIQTVHESVELKCSEHFCQENVSQDNNSSTTTSNTNGSSGGGYWMSDLIHVPSIMMKRKQKDEKKKEEAEAEDESFSVTVSMIPVKQSGVLVQPKTKFLVRLMAEHVIIANQSVSIPKHVSLSDAHNKSVHVPNLVTNSVGVYCLAVTDRKEYGPLSDRSSFLDRMTDMFAPQFEFSVQSDAFNCSEQVPKQFCTNLFPVYKCHTGPESIIPFKCSIRPLGRKGWSPEANLNILLLQVQSSEEKIVQCENLSSIAHTIVACIHQYKDGTVLENQLDLLRGSANNDSFKSFFLQADLQEALQQGEAIIRQKSLILRRIQDLENQCNSKGYEDVWESLIEAVNNEIETFGFEFADLKDAKQLMKLLPQRIALYRQLKKRLLYIRSKTAGKGLSDMTIDIIDRENRVLKDLQTSLSRAFNDDFSASEIVKKDMNELNEMICTLDARKEQIVKLIAERMEQEERAQIEAQENALRKQREEVERKQKELLLAQQKKREQELLRAQEEQRKEELRNSVSSSDGTDNAVSPSKSTGLSANDSTDQVSASGDNVTDTDESSHQNITLSERSRTEDNDDDLATSVVNSESSTSKKKKKKKKKRVIDTMEEIAVTSHALPVRIRKNSITPTSTSTPTTTTSNNNNTDNSHSAYAALDHGQVIYEMHQCLKQLLRIGAVNQTVVPSSSETDRLLIPKDDPNAVKKTEDFIYLVVRYILLGHRLVSKGKWFGKSAATDQPTPILTIIRGASDSCNSWVQAFETSLEQIARQESFLCEQFVRWAIMHHTLQPIVSTLLHNVKYASKFYSKNSLLCSTSFHDEFMCVLDLLGQMQLQCD